MYTGTNTTGSMLYGKYTKWRRNKVGCFRIHMFERTTTITEQVGQLARTELGLSLALVARFVGTVSKSIQLRALLSIPPLSGSLLYNAIVLD